MPIRMERDQPEKQGSGSKRSRNGSGLTKLLPLALMFVLRRPKLLIPVIIIGGLLYFFSGGQLLQPDSSYEYQASREFSFGAELSEAEYDKVNVFASLADGFGNALPGEVSLLEYAPKRLHQGRQGSCSGWATAYGARTISYARANQSSPDQLAFSPSFLYNQIALPGCQGAYMRDAMESLTDDGALPFRDFGYDERTCQILPDPAKQREAVKYRIKGYDRLSIGRDNYSPDIDAVKQHLAQGAPVVIGMLVGQSFMQPMMGQAVWQPSRRDYAGLGLGGHAMCVVGYDDQKAGGAFQLMNSWGSEWGEDGIGWVRYDDFGLFVKEAYGLYPEPKASDRNKDKLNVKFGLVRNVDKRLIPLYENADNQFRTRQPLRIGEKFKLAITNSIECYTYIFGRESDGSSYVLFPYTEKHSPYCGITGTRVFPRDYSMVPDEVGNKDFIAILISKKPLDYQEVNRQINRSQRGTYAQRVLDAVGLELIPDVAFEATEAVQFSCNTGDQNVVAAILEIDKQ